VNGNGLVSLSEVEQFVKQRYPILAHTVTLKSAFLHATQREGDGDSYLDEDELPALLRSMIYFTHVRHLCHAADDDGDERLSEKEFTEVSMALGIVKTPDEGSSAFRLADKDGSGTVRLYELCCWAAEHCCPIASARVARRLPKGAKSGVRFQFHIVQVSLLNDLNFTGGQSVHIIAQLGKQTFTSGKLTRPACVYRWDNNRGSGIVMEFPLPCLRMLSSGPPLVVRVFQTECKLKDDRLQVTHRKLVATRELGAFTVNLAQMVNMDEGRMAALECKSLIDSSSCPERVLPKCHLRVECSWKYQSEQLPLERPSRPQSAQATPRRLEWAPTTSRPTTPRSTTPRRGPQDRQDLTRLFFSARRAECTHCPMSARQTIDLQRRMGAW